MEQENGKSVEAELEKGGRCGRRGEKGELIYSKEENWSLSYPGDCHGGAGGEEAGRAGR